MFAPPPRPRNACQRLRTAVEAMPRPSREAMLRGIDDNTIIVGAYTDRDSGGICPMLAAHRNGGRTDLASFARSWDRYTDARRPRLATEREVRTLRSLLEIEPRRRGRPDRSASPASADAGSAPSAPQRRPAAEPHAAPTARRRVRGMRIRHPPPDPPRAPVPARRAGRLAARRAAAQVANALGSPGRANTTSGIRQ